MIIKNISKQCNQCECCLVFQKQIETLSERLHLLESSLCIPSEVVKWFDELKSLKRNTTKYVQDYETFINENNSNCNSRNSNLNSNTELQNIIKKMPIDLINLRRCHVANSGSATARNIIRALVPEKKLLAGMYLEDLDKLFGADSVNSIVGKL